MKPVRKLALTGIFSAIAFVLMVLEFPLPFLLPIRCRKRQPSR